MRIVGKGFYLAAWAVFALLISGTCAGEAPPDATIPRVQPSTHQ